MSSSVETRPAEMVTPTPITYNPLPIPLPRVTGGPSGNFVGDASLFPSGAPSAPTGPSGTFTGAPSMFPNAPTAPISGSLSPTNPLQPRAVATPSGVPGAPSSTPGAPSSTPGAPSSTPGAPSGTFIGNTPLFPSGAPPSTPGASPIPPVAPGATPGAESSVTEVPISDSVKQGPKLLKIGNEYIRIASKSDTFATNKVNFGNLYIGTIWKELHEQYGVQIKNANELNNTLVRLQGIFGIGFNRKTPLEQGCRVEEPSDIIKMLEFRIQTLNKQITNMKFLGVTRVTRVTLQTAKKQEQIELLKNIISMLNSGKGDATKQTCRSVTKETPGTSPVPPTSIGDIDSLKKLLQTIMVMLGLANKDKLREYLSEPLLKDLLDSLEKKGDDYSDIIKKLREILQRVDTNSPEAKMNSGDLKASIEALQKKIQALEQLMRDCCKDRKDRKKVSHKNTISTTPVLPNINNRGLDNISLNWERESNQNSTEGFRGPVRPTPIAPGPGAVGSAPNILGAPGPAPGTEQPAPGTEQPAPVPAPGTEQPAPVPAPGTEQPAPGAPEAPEAPIAEQSAPGAPEAPIAEQSAPGAPEAPVVEQPAPGTEQPAPSGQAPQAISSGVGPTALSAFRRVFPRGTQQGGAIEGLYDGLDESSDENFQTRLTEKLSTSYQNATDEQINEILDELDEKVTELDRIKTEYNQILENIHQSYSTGSQETRQSLDSQLESKKKEFIRVDIIVSTIIEFLIGVLGDKYQKAKAIEQLKNVLESIPDDILTKKSTNDMNGEALVQYAQEILNAYQAKLGELTGRINTLESDKSTKQAEHEGAIAELQRQLSEEQAKGAKDKAEIESIKAQLAEAQQKASADNQAKDIEIGSLRTQLQSLQGEKDKSNKLKNRLTLLLSALSLDNELKERIKSQLDGDDDALLHTIEESLSKQKNTEICEYLYFLNTTITMLLNQFYNNPTAKYAGTVINDMGIIKSMTYVLNMIFHAGVRGKKIPLIGEQHRAYIDYFRNFSVENINDLKGYIKDDEFLLNTSLQVDANGLGVTFEPGAVENTLNLVSFIVLYLESLKVVTDSVYQKCEQSKIKPAYVSTGKVFETPVFKAPEALEAPAEPSQQVSPPSSVTGEPNSMSTNTKSSTESSSNPNELDQPTKDLEDTIYYILSILKKGSTLTDKTLDADIKAYGESLKGKDIPLNKFIEKYKTYTRYFNPIKLDTEAPFKTLEASKKRALLKNALIALQNQFRRIVGIQGDTRYTNFLYDLIVDLLMTYKIEGEDTFQDKLNATIGLFNDISGRDLIQSEIIKYSEDRSKMAFQRQRNFTRRSKIPKSRF